MTAEPLPFRDASLSTPERVADLLARLTVEERIAMLPSQTPAVERLGLSAFHTGQEALHGVAWMGEATVFPQAVGLGATFNDDLLRRVGDAVGREARAMREKDARVGLNVWSPVVNLLRHPLWGRNEEGYAEDPHLTAALATAYTRGLRGDHPRYWRTAPLLKHWLAHNHEKDRDTASTTVRPRVLHEYELPAFAGPVRAGTVIGVMPAYNLVNGRPNHLSPLLAGELRAWTDRPLVVCSDAFAPSNIAGSQGYHPSHEEGLAAALRAGVDSFTDAEEETVGRLTRAFEQGLVTEADIDAAVSRLLAMRFELGEFDEIDDPEETFGPAFDTPEHRALALEAAEQAVVLLKNDGLLPLRPGVRLAVVGLLADEVKLDWYSGSLLRRVSPLQGLREHPSVASVDYAEGTDRVRLRCAAGWVTVPQAPEAGEEGVTAAPDPAGPPPVTISGQEDQAAVLDLVDWGGGVLTLRAPDGRYLSVAEDDGYLRASATQPGGWVVRETFGIEPHGDGHLLRHLGSGGYVRVTADGLKVADPDAGENGEVFRIETVERGEEAVARAAAGADAVIVVAGNDPHINGRETQDRVTLALPPHQERLWKAAHAANTGTVLVMTSSYPYAVPEADAALPALLWTAHGGQSAGTALARILTGEVSPAGRLPQTWYATDDQLPAMLDYDLIGSRATYLYSDHTPLYPFGHGLTYTAFAYTDLTATLHGDELTAEVTITNTGPRPGDEVVQLYTRATTPSVPRPHRQLVAHRRIHLAPGEARRLTFTIPAHQALGFWDVAHSRWTVEPGTYELQAGASSHDIRTSATVTVDGEPVGPRPVMSTGLNTADFDESHGIELVDYSKISGDSATPAGDHAGPGELVYRSCDFGPIAPSHLSLTAATTTNGAAPAEVELHVPGTAFRVTLAVPHTPDRYTYTTIQQPLDDAPTGIHDLRITLHGDVRLHRIEFAAPSAE